MISIALRVLKMYMYIVSVRNVEGQNNSGHTVYTYICRLCLFAITLVILIQTSDSKTESTLGMCTTPFHIIILSSWTLGLLELYLLSKKSYLGAKRG